MPSVLFAVPGGAAGPERLRALERFYGPLGVAGTELRAVPGGAVGWLAFTTAEHMRLTALAGRGLLWWGEPPPAALDGGAALAAAGDRLLRGLDGCGLYVAWGDGRLRIASGAGAPAAAYAAGEVVATHAVAAAVLAGRRPRVRAGLLAELLAFEHLLGDDTLLEGVCVLPAATVADRPGTGRRDFWPDRWAPVPAEEAAGEATAALLATLPRRAGATAAPWLGLTAGLDSRVVAAAAAEAGLRLQAFTWAHHPGEAEGARAVAARFGLPHAELLHEPLGDAAGLAAVRAEARWHEGHGRLTPFGRVAWPAPLTSFVTGGGGELARAFLYRLEGANRRDPTVEQLADVLRRGPRGRVLEQLWAAAASGHRGWAVLDVFYGQQRLWRWGRGMVAREGGAVVAAFATPAVARALASLAPEAKAADRWHREFLARHRVAGPPPPAQRSGVPPALRRLAARARRAGARDRRPFPYAGELAARPLYGEWLHDAVLRGPLVEAGLGRRRAAALRRGVERGLDAPVQQAVLASGVVALQEALADLGGR